VWRGIRTKKILILGGGIGGLVASNLLSKRLGKKHEVVLVDKKDSYEFTPAFPWIMMEWREPHQITRKLNLLEKKGVRYVNAEALKIDPANRTVKTSNGDFGYDYLIVALGAELAPETIPGFSKGAHHVYSFEAATKLREALKTFNGGTVAAGISSTPFKCPAAPYEVAFLMDYHFKKNGIRDRVDFHFFTPKALPMGVTGPKIGNMIKGMLENRGINYIPNIKLVSVDAGKRKITFENGESINYDLLFAVPPHRAPKVVVDAELTDETGWITVGMKTLKTKYDNLYAIGDVTRIRLPNGMMLPKAGVFAHGQAEVVARNIISEIMGNGEEEWKGDGSCFIEVGFGKAAMAKGNFYTEPDPVVKIRWPRVSRIWHWYKVLFEKYWLGRWF